MVRRMYRISRVFVIIEGAITPMIAYSTGWTALELAVAHGHMKLAAAMNAFNTPNHPTL